MRGRSVIEVRQYTPQDAPAWDAVVRQSRNGVFLFERAYMDYHADRFHDASLMVFDDDAVVAVLPASIDGTRVVSHGGLTFGGLIVTRGVRASTTLDALTGARDRFASLGADVLIYKAVPHIYHQLPSEEDLYALFRLGATLVRRDISSTVAMHDRIRFSKGRAHNAKKAARSAMIIGPDRAIDEFMAMETALLLEKYGVAPVHSTAEMQLLMSRFPGSVRLFSAREDDRLLAGVLIYESARVAHAQYIASTAEGAAKHALDGVVGYLLDQVYHEKHFFDFGISTERDGTYLNEGLIAFKESCGARAIAYDTYQLPLRPSLTA